MDAELVIVGTLDDTAPEQVSTLVANQITAYLEREDKVLNQIVLQDMLAAFERTVTRQLMQKRMDRKGYESTTTYTGPCAMKARLTFDGVQGEPIQARTMLKFILGDLVEMAVIGIAQLAGVDISMNNCNLFMTGRDGKKINVHPDGLVRTSDALYSFECKSCDSRTWDRWVDQGGPDDSWGYLTQCSVEVKAWQEAGYGVTSTCFVAVSTGSKQGAIKEWIIPYDQKLVDAWHDRRDLARLPDMPKVPFEAVPETDFVKGKSLEPEHFTHGEPVPRLDKNGKIHGYDVATGNKILPTVCSYCAYKGNCWPGSQMEVKGGRPIWICK